MGRECCCDDLGNGWVSMGCSVHAPEGANIPSNFRHYIPDAPEVGNGGRVIQFSVERRYIKKVPGV